MLELSPMLSYQIEGDGPPLLLIHGFGVSFSIWQNLRPLLKDDFTLIMIELPGIGKSPAPQGDYLETSTREIDQLRTALKIERWHIFSYSSGTRIAERYLENYADHVISVVYLCPIQIRQYKAIGLKLARHLDLWFPALGDWTLSGRRLNFLISFLGFSLKPSPYASQWMDEISSRPIGILKETLRCLPGDGAKPFDVPSIPCLFIWGKKDLITASPRKANAHHRLINTTHSAAVTGADQVAELSIPFLSSIG